MVEVAEPGNKCPVMHRNTVVLIFETPALCSRGAGRQSVFSCLWCNRVLYGTTAEYARLWEVGFSC